MSPNPMSLGALLALRCCCGHGPCGGGGPDAGPPDAAVSCPASLRWDVEPSGTAADLSGVWGSSPGDVYAVGAGGVIVHRVSGVWAPATSGATENLNAVWGSGAN